MGPTLIRCELFGSGLGLTVVQRVAAALGGSVALEPSERGACFRLFIPNAPELPGSRDER